MACYLTSPAVEAEIRDIVAAEAPDLVLIDGMFPAALTQASGFGRPSAVFVHTFVFRQLDMWRRIFATFSDMRQKAGYSALPTLDELWRSRERLISTSLAAFDAPPEDGWSHVVHVGPSLEDEKFAVPMPLPWPDDDERPLALVSFSTGFEQRNVDKVQRTLDALAGAPLRVVATTGGIVAPNEVAAPANAIVLDYAAHDPILARAAVVVGHGGHGTAMRAMRHGVPMAIIPGVAGDQPYVAKAVDEWGAGLALPADAAPETIRDAVGRLIAEPGSAPRRGGGRRRSPASTAPPPPPTKSRRCSPTRAANVRSSVREKATPDSARPFARDGGDATRLRPTVRAAVAAVLAPRSRRVIKPQCDSVLALGSALFRRE